MNKFIILMKKELRDILTLQTIIPIVLMVVLLNVMGSFMNDMISSISSTDGEATAKNTVAVIDMDNTDGSKSLVTAINMSGYNIFTPIMTDPTAAYDSHKDEFDVLIVIPDGFGGTLMGESGKSANIAVYSNVKSFSLMSMVSGSTISAVIDSVNQTLSDSLLAANLNSDAPDLEFIKNPIETTEYSRVNGSIEQIPPSVVSNIVSSQTMFVPIIIWIIVMFSSQTLAGSMTGEKFDKTLETLLTTPVNRNFILFAKMLSASLVSLAYAVVFMFSYDNMIGTMTGGIETATSMDYTAILENLGISFNVGTYAILGISTFLSIIIGLCIAMVIGVLAEDMKKLQSLLMPLIIIMMIPYLVSMFVDINTLPMIARVLLYIIPFTHTFTAIGNVFTSNFVMLIIGLVYQFIFLLVGLGITRNIFATDKLFTLKLDFSKKKKTPENQN